MVWNPTKNTLGDVVEEALADGLGQWAPISEVRDGLMAWLSDWADEQRKKANEATAAKLKAAIDNAVELAAVPGPPYLPRRDDAVAAWLKQARDRYARPDQPAHLKGWYTLDLLLDEYREHADTGTPLGQYAGPHPEQ